MSEEDRVALYWPTRVLGGQNGESSYKKKAITTETMPVEIEVLEGGCMLYRSLSQKRGKPLLRS